MTTPFNIELLTVRPLTPVTVAWTTGLVASDGVAKAEQAGYFQIASVFILRYNFFGSREFADRNQTLD
jgi:hypothetical protein